MKKIVMNLDEYKGNCAMHCTTEESAKLFCNFLNEMGRFWNDGTSYLAVSYWNNCKENTLYFFNEGLYGDYRFRDEKCTILEIEDFIQDVKEE